MNDPIMDNANKMDLVRVAFIAHNKGLISSMHFDTYKGDEMYRTRGFVTISNENGYAFQFRDWTKTVKVDSSSVLTPQFIEDAGTALMIANMCWNGD